ncbi:hypothetical protein AB5N19_11996 [Seiridium cardinale]
MAIWRGMTLSDIVAVSYVANSIHPSLPESDYVFAERVELFPKGCMVLVEGDEVCGYAISHPIRQCQTPALDSLIESIPVDADQYYIHDIAILPKARGGGHAAAGITKLLAVGERFPTTCLISIYGTAPFWSRFGFVPEPVDGVLAEKLLDYGDDATYLVRRKVFDGTTSLSLSGF